MTEILIATLVGLLAILIAFVARETVGDAVRAQLRWWRDSYRPVHEIEWPEGEVAFEKSWEDVYPGHIHPDLVPTKEDLQRWLRESAMTEVSDEIYIVKRNVLHRRFEAALYATLYPANVHDTSIPRRSETDRCFVWSFVSNAEPGKEESEQEVRAFAPLWSNLRNVIRSRPLHASACEYYFEAFAPAHKPECAKLERERDRRTRYLAFLCSPAVRARIIDFPYVSPDWKAWREHGGDPLCYASPAVLLYCREPSLGKDAVPLDEVLRFVYKTVHLWGFTYGVDALELEELQGICHYYEVLTSRLAAAVATDHRLVDDQARGDVVPAVDLVLCESARGTLRCSERAADELYALTK